MFGAKQAVVRPLVLVDVSRASIDAECCLAEIHPHQVNRLARAAIPVRVAPHCVMLPASRRQPARSLGPRPWTAAAADGILAAQSAIRGVSLSNDGGRLAHRRILHHLRQEAGPELQGPHARSVSGCARGCRHGRRRGDRSRLVRQLHHAHGPSGELQGPSVHGAAGGRRSLSRTGPAREHRERLCHHRERSFPAGPAREHRPVPLPLRLSRCGAGPPSSGW